MMLAILAATQVAAVPAVEDEIVVIGRRFAQAAVIVGKDARGRFTCDLTASSGNARLDERLCRTASKCVIEDATDSAVVKACIDRKKPGLFTDFRREYLKSRGR